METANERSCSRVGSVGVVSGLSWVMSCWHWARVSALVVSTGSNEGSEMISLIAMAGAVVVEEVWVSGEREGDQIWEEMVV